MAAARADVRDGRAGFDVEDLDQFRGIGRVSSGLVSGERRNGGPRVYDEQRSNKATERTER